MTGDIYDKPGLNSSTGGSQDILKETIKAPLPPVDSSIQNIMFFKRKENQDGKVILKIHDISGMEGKKVEKLHAKAKEGKYDFLVLEKNDGKYNVRILESGKVMAVVELEIIKHEAGAKKTNKIAQENFNVETMSASEYERTRDVFMGTVEDIVNRMKEDEQEGAASLEGRGNHISPNNKKYLESQTARDTAQNKMQGGKNQIMKSDVAQEARNASIAEHRKQDKLDEKHQEEIDAAVKEDIQKRKVLKEELKKQGIRISTSQGEDAAPAA